MKIIPCDTCRKPALASRSPEIFHSIGTLIDTERIRCRRCGRTITVTAMMFAALPNMTPEQIAAPTCDIDTALLVVDLRDRAQVDAAHLEAQELDRELASKPAR